MSKVTDIKAHVKVQQELKDEADVKAFNAELDAIEVTPEIRAEIEEKYAGKQVEVVSEGKEGTARTSLDQYLGEITNFNTRMSSVIKQHESQKTRAMDKLEKDISLIIPSLDKSSDGILQAVKETRDKKVLEDCINEEASLEDLDKIIDDTFEAIRRYMKVDKLRSEHILKFLQKSTPGKILEVIPKAYFENFILNYEQTSKMNVLKFKNEVNSILSYQHVVGPEMDDLQKFMEDENHTMEVFMKLASISFNFTDAIASSDPTDVIERFIKMHPDVNQSYKIGELDFYPDKIQRIAAQKAYGFRVTRDGYEKFKEEFAGDEKALAIIDKEIANCNHIIETIEKSHDIENFLKYMRTFVPTIKSDQKYVAKIISSAYEQATKMPIRIAFPGYHGNEKTHGEAAKNLEDYIRLIYDTHNKLVREMPEENRPNEIEITDIKVFGHCLMMLIAIDRYFTKTKKHREIKDVAYEISHTMAAISSLAGDVYSVAKLHDTFEEILEADKK